MPPSFDEVRRRALERRLDALIEEYEAVEAQRRETLDPASRVKLERQAARLAQEAAAVEAGLADLAPAGGELPARAAGFREETEALREALAADTPAGALDQGGRRMAARGIPPELNRKLREALAATRQFRSTVQVYDLFDDERLAPFGGSVPERHDRNARIAAIISYLHDRWRTDNRNALVLLLEVLADQVDERNQLHATLLDLAAETASVFGGEAPGEMVVLESGFGSGERAYIAVHRRVVELAESVALVRVLKMEDGAAQEQTVTGTAWLVAPGLALTCRHVLAARGPYDPPVSDADFAAQVANALLIFDHVNPAEGFEYQVKELVRADAEIDYALLRLQDRPQRPLAARETIPLDLSPALTEQTALVIVQHPNGAVQQQAPGRYAGPGPVPAQIAYRASTDPGASGSPVFNQIGWRALAVHRGKVAGSRLPTGILVQAILDDLQQREPDVWQEIQAAQRALG